MICATDRRAAVMKTIDTLLELLSSTLDDLLGHFAVSIAIIEDLHGTVAHSATTGSHVGVTWKSGQRSQHS
jgi:hypothetical protein